MSKLALSLVLFIFGVMLSGVVLYASGHTTSTTYRNVPQKKQSAQVVRVSNDLEEDLRRSLPLGKGLQKLLTALDDGTQSALQLIRLEFLRTVPNYEGAVLPSIKERALNNLISRFRESDWEDWPRAAYAANGGPSTARLYVDDIFSLNRDLGSFLETSALLLHGVYLNTKYGHVYDLDQGLQYTLSNADKLLTYRANSAIPARTLLTPSVLIDPAFIRPFERERARIVTQYMEQHPTEISTHLDLLGSLDPAACAPDTFQQVVSLLTHLSRDASAGFRERVLRDKERLEALRNFASSDSRVRRALGNLFCVAAVDSLEGRNLRQAQEYYQASMDLDPNLRSQEFVRSFLREHGVEQFRPRAPEELALAKQEHIEREVNRIIEEPVAEETPSGRSWLWLIAGIALILAGTGLGYLAFRRFRVDDDFDFTPPEDIDVPTDSYNDWNIDDLRFGVQDDKNEHHAVELDAEPERDFRVIKSANG